jgi:hypothetical protein
MLTQTAWDVLTPTALLEERLLLLWGARGKVTAQDHLCKSRYFESTLGGRN